MANTSSAKKKVRVIERKTISREMYRNKIKTYIKKVESLITEKDQKSAMELLKKVDPKPHLFLGKSREKDQELNTKEAEEEYKAFIESIENGLIEGYGQDELNRVIDIRALKQGNISEFDAILDHKML